MSVSWDSSDWLAGDGEDGEDDGGEGEDSGELDFWARGFLDGLEFDLDF